MAWHVQGRGWDLREAWGPPPGNAHPGLFTSSPPFPPPSSACQSRSQRCWQERGGVGGASRSGWAQGPAPLGGVVGSPGDGAHCGSPCSAPEVPGSLGLCRLSSRAASVFDSEARLLPDPAPGLGRCVMAQNSPRAEHTLVHPHPSLATAREGLGLPSDGAVRVQACVYVFTHVYEKVCTYECVLCVHM